MEVAGVPQRRVYLVVSGQGGYVARNVPLPGRQRDPVVGPSVLDGRSFSRRCHARIVAVLFGVWRLVWEPYPRKAVALRGARV